MSDSATTTGQTPEIIFTLTIEAQDMQVRYRPDCYVFEELEFADGHLEFHSPHEPRRRIPVSELAISAIFFRCGRYARPRAWRNTPARSRCCG